MAGENERYRGKLRVRVGGLILREGELLLVKLQPPTRPHPIWMPPGGGVQQGEPLETALKREVLEETGLEIETGRLCLVHEFIESPYHAIEFYFTAETYSGTLQRGADPELDINRQILSDLKFFSFSRLNQIELYPEYLRRHIRDIIDHDNEIHHIKTFS